MKIKQLVALATAALMLTACGAKTNNNDNNNNNNNNKAVATDSQKPKGEGLKVVTTTYILRDLTQEIAGDKATVTCLIPKGQGVHGFEPSPKDMNQVNEADLFIYNGAGLESFTDRFKETTEGDATFVEASEGIELLKGGHHHHHDEDADHDHDHDAADHDHDHDAADHDHDHDAAEHDHEHDAAEHDHEHEGMDPHVWMSPENAEEMAKNICEALSAKDPDNAAFYKANYEKLSEKFDALNDSFEKVLSKAKYKDIVVSHEAYGYLAKEFGLNQIPIEGINSESEPDPKAMKTIVDEMKAKGIKTVFTEPHEDDKIAQTIASEAGAQVKELDPMEYESDKNYFERMESNLKTLESALQ
ncbi:metal ABC transporter substrate-binding protein [Peptoniphilus sp. EMRHCC_23]|uniref:metal ABC transporter substrate-binding protein n=1 Tax=Peptoniphilus rachelemmaiella TaxID=2811779 RepID=UPI001C001F3B|nr:metal ABC transporter substrate-binding protein [Peptoniphilus rachelemmaiella]